jgi:hypothetical protein
MDGNACMFPAPSFIIRARQVFRNYPLKFLFMEEEIKYYYGINTFPGFCISGICPGYLSRKKEPFLQ